MKKLLLISLVLLTLYGCVPSPVVATVNGESLDASEFAFYMNYQLMSREEGEEIGEEELAQIKETALSQMITNTLIRQKCEKYGLELTKETEENIKNLKKEFIETLGGTAKYLDFLNESAMNDRTYDKSQENPYYQNMLRTYLTENTDLPETIGFTDEKLRQYFSENYVKLKYIFINAVNKNEEPLSPSEYNDMQEFARVVAEGSREENKDFDQLIEKYNSDSQMSLNPDGLVYSKEELLETEVFKNVLDLQENEIGGPYSSDEGFYIIKRIPVDAGYFDSHKEQIERDAENNRYEALIEEWKASSTIKVSEVYKKIDHLNYKDYIK